MQTDYGRDRKYETGCQENALDYLAIQRIPVDDPEYVSELPKHLKGQENHPGFPSTSVVVGPPGSGKTNLLMNLLHNKKMWNKFFDEIYAYGPTVESDKLYKTIKLKDENICADVDQIVPKLKSSLETQTKKVKQSPSAAPKVLYLFEDMTSFFNTVQHKPEFIRCYTQIRHIKGASIAMVHKYHAFNRTCRICSQHLLIFKTNKRDLEHIYKEFGPDLPIEDFFDMCNYAFEPTEANPKPFLYINTLVDEKIRFRKSFTEILRINPDHQKYAIMSNKRPKKSLRERPAPRRRRSKSPTEGRQRKNQSSRSRSAEREGAFGKKHFY